MNKLAALLLLAGPALAGESPGVDAAAVERLVLQDCGSCHGMTLKGGLGPDIRPQALAHHDPASLADVIAHGVPGTPMPPWQPLLTEAELNWIVTYLLTGAAE